MDDKARVFGKPSDKAINAARHALANVMMSCGGIPNHALKEALIRAYEIDHPIVYPSLSNVLSNPKKADYRG